MKKVIVLIGEIYYEGQYIIEIFDFKELDKIVKDVVDYDCYQLGENKWKEILRDDFKEKYCNGFDSYFISVRDIIEVD